jgi:hypothetical protein
MNIDRMVENWISLYLLNILTREEAIENRELIANSEMKMRGIPKFTLSHSHVDVNAPIDFPEELTITPQNGSDT